MLSDAAVRVGLAALDKFEQVQDERRAKATVARSAAKQAEQEKRWGSARDLLRQNPKRSSEEMFRRLRANKETVKHPPTDEERSTFNRYVRRVKEEMKKECHSLSE